MANDNSSGGIGLGGALLIVFITLKLCNVIDWSWWWVLSPIWISLSLALLLGIVYLFLRKKNDNKLSTISKSTKFRERYEQIKKQQEELNK